MGVYVCIPVYMNICTHMNYRGLYNIKMFVTTEIYKEYRVTTVDDCVILFTSWESIELLIP